VDKKKEKRDKKTKKKKRKDRQQTEVAKRGVVTDAINGNKQNVLNKEIYTSGEKIMISVNFRQEETAVATTVDAPIGQTEYVEAVDPDTLPPPTYTGPSAAEIAAGKTPSAVIDLEDPSGPVVYEASPKAFVDLVCNEGEDEKAACNVAGPSRPPKGPCTPPPEEEPKDEENATNLAFTRGPETPPDPNDDEDESQNQDLKSGDHDAEAVPSTSTEDKSIGNEANAEEEVNGAPGTPDSYDPCQPTQSPSPPHSSGQAAAADTSLSLADKEVDDIVENLWDEVVSTTGSANVSSTTSGQQEKPESSSAESQPAAAAPSAINASSSSSLALFDSLMRAAQGAAATKSLQQAASSSSLDKAATSEYSPVGGGGAADMDVVEDDDDSPTSPQGSDLSDLFEPPPTSSDALSRKKAKKSTFKKRGQSYYKLILLCYMYLEMLQDIQATAPRLGSRNLTPRAAGVVRTCS